MKLLRATFQGVRGVPDLTLDLTSPKTGAPSALAVITGPSGSGKTRLLEALLAAKEAIAPYGLMPSAAAWTAAGATVSKVSLVVYLDADEMAFAGAPTPTLEAEVRFEGARARASAGEGLTALLGRYSHDPGQGKVEYFPASRRIPSFPPFAGLGAAEQRLYRASSDTRKYSFIPKFLKEVYQDPNLQEALQKRLAGLTATCRYDGSSPSPGMPRCFSSGGDLKTTAELSDSEADAVLFAATAAAIGLHRSIVLIDRPELYLGGSDPSGSLDLLRGLAALGDDNQIILATSSASIVAAAEGSPVTTLEGA